MVWAETQPLPNGESGPNLGHRFAKQVLGAWLCCPPVYRLLTTGSDTFSSALASSASSARRLLSGSFSASARAGGCRSSSYFLPPLPSLQPGSSPVPKSFPAEPHTYQAVPKSKSGSSCALCWGLGSLQAACPCALIPCIHEDVRIIAELAVFDYWRLLLSYLFSSAKSMSRRWEE